MQSLCTLRGRRCRRLTQHSLPGCLARASRADLSSAGLHQLWLAPSEKIFKNYALKSMDAVRVKLKQAILYIERNRKLVRSIASFPYLVNSL